MKSWKPFIFCIGLLSGGSFAGEFYINNTDVGIINYSGEWFEGVNASRYMGSAQSTTKAGSSFEFKFDGNNEVSFIGELHPNHGDAEVFVDGVSVGTFSLVGSVRQSTQVVFTLNNFPAGAHTAKLVTLNNKHFPIEAIKLTSRDEFINNDNPNHAYEGEWLYSGNRQGDLVGNDLHYTTQKDASVTIPFVGTGVEILSEINHTHGDAEVILDGKSLGLLSLTDTDRAQETIFYKNDLEYGEHSVKLVKHSGMFTVYDAYAPLIGGDKYSSLDSTKDGVLDKFDVDFDNDLIADNVDSDDDGDRIPDVDDPNPLDPIDGTLDPDGDGLSNAEEYLANTNPNDHLIQVDDSFSASLLIYDTNGDGSVNDDDERFDVELTRYSLRTEGAELWILDKNHPDKYIKYTPTPEVRTFRGLISDVPDAFVVATVWGDCSISYGSIVGYSVEPNFKHSSDGIRHYESKITLPNAGEFCNPTDVSDASFQMGLKADITPINNLSDNSDDTRYHHPIQGSEFHLYSKPQWHQMSNHNFVRKLDSNIINTVAFFDTQANVVDLHTTKTFFDRLPLTDMLIELTGDGDIYATKNQKEWGNNLKPALEEFWAPRRTQMEDRYYWEGAYWNNPVGASGYAHGERFTCSTNVDSYWCHTHEAGHNYGNSHLSFPERFQGANAMSTGGTRMSLASTISNQGEAIERRDGRVRAGVHRETELRVRKADWEMHPLAQPDLASAYRDETITIDVLANDMDANNDSLSVSAVGMVDVYSSEGAEKSSFIITPDNKVKFTPPKGFVGLIDAYYVVVDEKGLSSKGILRINVEHDGISDVFTFNDCKAKVTQSGYNGFKGTTKDHTLAIMKGDFTTPYDSCEEVVLGEQDNEHVTRTLVQGAISAPSIRGESDNVKRYVPHLYEINNKDFTVALRYKPSDKLDLNDYTLLASRGRSDKYTPQFDDDGWVVATHGDVLRVQIHDKVKESKKSVLYLDVPELPELLDTNNWVHVAMTLDWGNRLMKAYVNGQKVGEVNVPEHFKLVSSSGFIKAYSGGALAQFGQTIHDDKGYNSLDDNGGTDDIVVAHKALTDQEVYELYLGEYPALLPTPTNGSLINTQNLKSLKWKIHNQMTSAVTSVKVYLSKTIEDVLSSTESAVVYSGDPVEFVDLELYELEKDTAYYWRVDLSLADESVKKGEVWSFWGGAIEGAAPLIQSAKIESITQEDTGDELIFEGDTTHFEDDYEDIY